VFTGIIEATAEVFSRGAGELTIERPRAFNDLRKGASIAISGACLTVAAFDGGSVTFDVMPETLRRTTIGVLKGGDRVNLERALPAHGRFEGHVVQGHGEGVGVVVSAPTPHPPPPWGGEGEVVERGRGGKTYPARSIVERARALRKRSTKSEALLWGRLRDHQLGIHFRRQRPVGRFILDFYCEESRVGIEVDGGIHQWQREYDEDREEELMARGIRLVHLKSEDIERDIDGTLRSIVIALQGTPLPERGRGRGGGDGDFRLTIRIPPGLRHAVVPKGSIAVDGVSLTVADTGADTFTVALIPTTLSGTTLGERRRGDPVNIETDVLVRTLMASDGRL
jgi:riboflavin synthase alpha subunit/very-short-patch-repair endonuclease